MEAGHINLWGNVLTRVAEIGRLLEPEVELPHKWIVYNKASWDWLSKSFQKEAKFLSSVQKKELH